MPTRLFPVLALLWLVLAPPAPLAAGALVGVVARYPHDPAAYTQGLLLDGGALYESVGHYGRSELRRVDPATGGVLGRAALDPRFFGEGLALLKGRLYQLTWLEGRVLVYDAATLARVGEFPLPTEGWGLTTDGARLVASDGSDVLRFYEPESFRELGRVSVTENGQPLSRLNELEWVGGSILANVYGQDRLVVIAPATGRVTASIDLSFLRQRLGPERGPEPPEVLNGVAYDPSDGTLLVTGKYWPNLFRVKVAGLFGAAPGLPIKTP